MSVGDDGYADDRRREGITMALASLAALNVASHRWRSRRKLYTIILLKSFDDADIVIGH